MATFFSPTKVILQLQGGQDNITTTATTTTTSNSNPLQVICLRSFIEEVCNFFYQEIMGLTSNRDGLDCDAVVWLCPLDVGRKEDFHQSNVAVATLTNFHK